MLSTAGGKAKLNTLEPLCLSVYFILKLSITLTPLLMLASPSFDIAGGFSASRRGLFCVVPLTPTDLVGFVGVFLGTFGVGSFFFTKASRVGLSVPNDVI